MATEQIPPPPLLHQPLNPQTLTFHLILPHPPHFLSLTSHQQTHTVQTFTQRVIEYTCAFCVHKHMNVIT